MDPEIKQAISTENLLKEMRKENKELKKKIKKLEMKKDIKYMNIPDICFSLTKKSDKRDKKYAKQRIDRGFDDSETWSLRDTIANFIIPRLEKYTELADKMIIRPDELKKQTNSFLTAMKLISREKGGCIFTDKENKQVEEGLNAFPEIFMSLWW